MKFKFSAYINNYVVFKFTKTYPSEYEWVIFNVNLKINNIKKQSHIFVNLFRKIIIILYRWLTIFFLKIPIFLFCGDATLWPGGFFRHFLKYKNPLLIHQLIYNFPLCILFHYFQRLCHNMKSTLLNFHIVFLKIYVIISTIFKN